MHITANRREWLKWAAAGVAAALAVWIFSLIPVFADHRFSVCFSRRFLNVSCPGCGLTRAFVLLARGDVPGSLAFHPLALLLALEAVLLWLAWPLVLLKAVPRPSAGAINAWLLVHLGLLVAVWLIRLVTGTLP